MLRKNNRPTQFEQAAADEFITRMVAGESIRVICTDAHMPSHNTIWEWQNGKMGAPSSWKDDYARGRWAQADAFANDTVAIADSIDDTAHNAAVAAMNDLPEGASEVEKRRTYFFAKKRSIEGAKLMIAARQWAAARMNPQRWGDRVTLEHVGDNDRPIQIDLSQLSTEQLEWLQVLQKQLKSPAEQIPATVEVTATPQIVESVDVGAGNQ